MAAPVYDVKWHKRRFEELKAIRLPREGEWEQIAQYFMPTKTFNISQPKGHAVPRRVMTSVPQRTLSKFQGMLLGFWVDFTQPFLKPNVTQGLVNAGRRVELSAASKTYLENLSWQMFDTMMLPRRNLMPALAATTLELPGFGTAVQWTGHRRGFGPIYMNRPLRSCWLDVNEDDVVDTLFYKFPLTLEQLFAKYPDGAAKSEKLRDLYNTPDQKNHSKVIEVLHCVYPRRGGEAGAVGPRKPFAEYTFAPEYDAELMVSGFDDFPYSVPRLKVESGNPYGQGLAWQALPPAIALNYLLALVEHGVGTRVSPPAFMSRRIFKTINRGIGAINVYDPQMLGFSKLKDMMEFMPVGGDVGVGVDWIKVLTGEIEDCFMIDWLRVPERSGMTATEVNYHKRLGTVGMSGFSAACDRPLFGTLGDRTLDIMGREGMIAEPPPELSGVAVDHDFAGPLALTQQEQVVDRIDRVFDLVTKAASFNPGSTAIVAAEEGIRAAAEAMGAPPSLLLSDEAWAEKKAKMAQQQAAQAEAETAATGAQALRDGGQGMAALAAMGGGPSAPPAQAA